ncbi:TIGR03943 family protein [Sporolactobacillus sp. CPB3-1]|uniref:TIGR03943 family protein n=1 Tax=Sporolactobacillus mangiferae TaxID=2940498 RepID=A0ABT0M7E5_9BACL|nr:TIGR03943 family protein [Sporolactobacillus mangiferae]MCL1630759.1 TIGR03943 family protein [Sporolactobacillus mangiferae]
MDERRISRHHYLRGIVLGGMALFLFRISYYGDLKYYLAPKLAIYAQFTIGALALLSLIHFVLPPVTHRHDNCDDCEHHHSLPKKGLHSLLFFSLFFLPVLTGFVFPHYTLGSAIASNRSFKQAIPSQTARQEKGVKKTATSAGAQRNPISQEQFDALKQKLLKRQKIVVDDAQYTYILNILEQDPSAFRGKQLVLKGVVYRDSHTPTNEIVTARFDISCCIADASVYGIRTKGSVTSLKKDTWIQVTGTLETVSKSKTAVPVLTRTNIQPIKEPDHPYVYDNGVLLE